MRPELVAPGGFVTGGAAREHAAGQSPGVRGQVRTAARCVWVEPPPRHSAEAGALYWLRQACCGGRERPLPAGFLSLAAGAPAALRTWAGFCLACSGNRNALQPAAGRRAGCQSPVSGAHHWLHLAI